MSRITDGAVQGGDTLDAASLNDRFASYTQTDLNQFNHRDAAYDLPQFSSAPFIAKQAFSQKLGTTSFKHTTTTTVNGQTAMPAAPVAIAGTLSFGAGMALDAGDVLRVYWNLSVKSNPGTNWNNANSLAYYEFNDGSGGTRKAHTWGAVWAFFIEWDTTSSALSNFQGITGQSDFSVQQSSGKYGNPLGQCLATSVFPAEVRFADPELGLLVGATDAGNSNWRGISGAYFFERAGPLTVYGMRLVVKGIMHPHSIGSENYLVHDTAYSNGATLEYTSGNLSVLRQRVK